MALFKQYGCEVVEVVWSVPFNSCIRISYDVAKKDGEDTEAAALNPNVREFFPR